MKKKLLATLLCSVLCFGLTGCQGATRGMGGSMTLELEPNTKLELITWKDDDSLWYLTRPMREDEEPEVHTYQESSEFGIWEGSVTIIESRK